MALKDLFIRTKTYDCLLVDEVADGMPITEGTLEKLPLDGDAFQDKHRGYLYTRDRSIRPIRVTIDNKVRSIYLIARRCGASMGCVMLNEGKEVKRYEIQGQTIPLVVDDLVLKIWTDPALAFHINDNNGLKSLTKQNLLGIEMLLLLTLGIILGWFVVGPVMNYLVSYAVHMISGFLGGL